jgi:hypothetical protein
MFIWKIENKKYNVYLKNWESEIYGLFEKLRIRICLFEKLRIRNIMFIWKIDNQKYNNVYLKNWESEI